MANTRFLTPIFAISNKPLRGVITITPPIKISPATNAITLNLFDNNFIFDIGLSFLQLKQWNNLAMVNVKNAIVVANPLLTFKPI